ncbi:MAG: S8/S53 family peptidase [Thermoplasmatota archaeon]
MKGEWLAVILLLSTSGCVASTSPFQSTQVSGTAETSPVVIALIDNGINPYHEEFRLPAGLAVDLSSFRDVSTGRTPVEIALDLTEPDLHAAFRHDATTWGSLQRGVLYHFAGTRILAIGFEATTRPQVIPYLEGDHGTWTSSVALNHSSGSWILMVQTIPELQTPPAYDMTDGHVANPVVIDAMKWIAIQPWIDVVSLSFAVDGHAPTPTEDAFGQATRAAWQSGKILIAGAGNDPTPGITDSYGDPPWMITATGVEPSQHGRDVLSSNLADVTANFTERAADWNSTDQYYPVSGTSFSAPVVAGELARAIHAAREAWHWTGGIRDGALAIAPDGTRLTNAKLRDALNASAVYWDPTGWDPTQSSYPSNDTLDRALTLSVPVNPVAPYTQMGWGNVDHKVGNEIIRRILADDYSLPAEKQTGASQFMAAAYAARQAYWNAVLGGS